MNIKLRKKGIKLISSILVLAMIITFLPINNFSNVFAETNSLNSNTNGMQRPSERKEIQSIRTENSKTYLNPDGTYTSVISQDPIHFKNKMNQWETINNKLITNSTDGTFQNKANKFTVKFDKRQNPNKPIVKIEENNHSAEMNLEPLENTGQKPNQVYGVVQDNTVKYPNIYSNIDLNYKVGSDRVKEDILYREKPTEGFPSEFTYKVNLDGYKVKEIGGVIYLVDATSNKPVYYFETPYMYDSYKPEGFKSSNDIQSIPEEAISYNVDLTYEIVDNQLLLHLVPDKKWLEDSNRVYPITIDPTIVRIQSSSYIDDTNLRSSFPTQTGGNDLEIGGGTSSGNTIRSLMKFDLFSIPRATIILSSSLDLYFSSTNSSSPINMSLYKINRDWNENEASWNYAKISPSTAWTIKGGDYETTKLATLSGLTSPTSLDNDLKKCEISTSIIQDWKDNPSSNFGFLLKSDTESSNIYKKFISSENSVDEKYHPKLVVTYKSNARLGLEDYWPYDAHTLVGGMSYSNLTTDNNVIQYTDFSLPGRGGFGLEFTRTYNSKSQEKSVMGYGWTFTGNEKLYLNIKGMASILNYQDEDGTDHEFTYDGPTATYYSDSGNYLTITKSTEDSSIYTMQDKYGYKTTFKIIESSSDTNVKVAYIQSKEDRHKNLITYHYDENNRIKSITSDLGNGIIKSINFTYNPDGLVDTVSYGNSKFTYHYVEDGSGRVEYVDQEKDSSQDIRTRTTFLYTEGLLSTIIDPNDRHTDYTYDKGYLMKVQDPQDINGTRDPANRPGITYHVDTVNKVSTVTNPEGDVTTYYTNENYVTTKKIDSGITTMYTLDSNYNLLSILKNGKTTTTNTYDANGNLLYLQQMMQKIIMKVTRMHRLAISRR